MARLKRCPDTNRRNPAKADFSYIQGRKSESACRAREDKVFRLIWLLSLA
jgi:hypothetical protein